MCRICLAVAAIAAMLFVAFADRSVAVPPNDPPKPKEAVPAEPNKLKLPTRKEAMALKLKSSQIVLEGIALNDFEKIQTAAKDLLVVSNLTEFLNAYKGAEYQFHVKIFRQPAETIIRKAKERNMDGVMVAYNDLTLSCLKCHQAMRDRQFEINTEVPPRHPRGD